MIKQDIIKSKWLLKCDCCGDTVKYDTEKDLEEDLQLFNDWRCVSERRINGATRHYCPACSIESMYL